MALTSDDIAALYDDAERCAEVAGLCYVAIDDEPGIRRVRSGRGFRYTQANGRPVSAAAKQRIAALVIPPAWQDVWICTNAKGHIQAVGTDDRGRRQYLYHSRWREVRDLLNFNRLVGFGERLPAVRRHVKSQLRRRTVDRELVVATMLRIVDCCGIRAGSEVYAEENDSFGLSTLSRRHVTVSRSRVQLRFPAKSGRRAEAVIDDAAVARVIGKLTATPGRRLFRVDGEPIGAEEVNATLANLTDARVTLKDFRTWRGTREAFVHLRGRLDAADREAEVLAAIAIGVPGEGGGRSARRDPRRPMRIAQSSRQTVDGSGPEKEERT